MVYLVKFFNLGQVGASNITGIWSGVSNCMPLIGAAVVDSYLGKVRTIAMSSFGTLVGCSHRSAIVKTHITWLIDELNFTSVW